MTHEVGSASIFLCIRSPDRCPTNHLLSACLARHTQPRTCARRHHLADGEPRAYAQDRCLHGEPTQQISLRASIVLSSRRVLAHAELESSHRSSARTARALAPLERTHDLTSDALGGRDATCNKGALRARTTSAWQEELPVEVVLHRHRGAFTARVGTPDSKFSGLHPYSVWCDAK